MDDWLKEADARSAARKKQRELDNIKQEHKIAEDKAALAAAVDVLKENAAKLKSGDSAKLEMAAKYTHILDGLFDHYLEKSKDLDDHERAIGMALKAHQQAIRSLYVWHKLKSDQ